MIASYTHSDALLRIDPGERVDLYYRVDPDDDVAPLQALISSATASYDSLEGRFGNQSAPLGANGDAGGARRYTSAASQATIQIIPVEVSPKQVVRGVEYGTLRARESRSPVSIGEEVEFQLEALIPVAQLRNFVIRDELPVGLSCTDAPTIDLSAGAYAAAGFVPGRRLHADLYRQPGRMEFRQSDRHDVGPDGSALRIPGPVRRRASTISSAARTARTIRNGGTSTVTEVRYVNEVGADVVLAIGEAALLVCGARSRSDGRLLGCGSRCGRSASRHRHGDQQRNGDGLQPEIRRPI